MDCLQADEFKPRELILGLWSQSVLILLKSFYANKIFIIK